MRTLPFFLTMEGCPRRCVYCHQGEITGISRAPSPAEVKQTAAEQREPCEVCFFGGSFTCLPSALQREYLDAALSAPAGSILRFSTHPECITEETLGLLASYPVRMIELGISSLDDRVLARCRRGYSSRSALEAMRRVLDSGFLLGAQMMIGLPEQTEGSSLDDLDLIAELKAPSPPTLRIYPCLVLEGTSLAQSWREGTYTPLPVDHAARWAGRLLLRAETLGFPVQRIGLQETESLSKSVLAGPHHPALGELARSAALALRLSEVRPQGPWRIEKEKISWLRGHGKFGIGLLQEITGLSAAEVEKRIQYA